MMHRYIYAAGSCLAASTFAGNVTYTVSPNPSVCREVHLGKLTKPKVIDTHSLDGVNTGYCHPEIRAAGESELYMTAACKQFLPATGRHSYEEEFPLSPEKYAVDLSRSGKVRQIDEATWQRGTSLHWGDRPYAPNIKPDPSGVKIGGTLLEKSGPAWAGVGGPPLGPIENEDRSRASVYSWDGFDVTYDAVFDPTAIFERNKVEGHYWVDIYDSVAGRRLILIQGTFKNAEPVAFQGHSSWYGTRYFVMPVGGTMWTGGFDLRRLLICDTDAAARDNPPTLEKRK